MEAGSENERAPITGRVSFLGDAGLGRTLRDVAGFYVAAIGLIFLSVAAMFLVSEFFSGPVGNLFFGAIPVLFAVGSITGVMVAKGRWSLATAGWPRLRPGSRWFLKGLFLGGVMAGAVVLLGLLTGAVRIAGDGVSSGYSTTVGPILLGLSFAALAEELLFRGYPLLKLAALVGTLRASVLLAFGFSALHLANPDVTGLGLLNIGLASLVLSAVFFTHGGLSAAWGLHFGWNAGLALVDAPVSGINFGVPGLSYVAGEPAWLTGGGFGPEGGALASVVMIVALWWVTQKWISEKKV